MPAFICTTCGTQYPESEAPPAHCTICRDVLERVAVDEQQVGKRALLDHAQLARIGIARPGQAQQLGIGAGRHRQHSAGVYHCVSLTSSAP